MSDENGIPVAPDEPGQPDADAPTLSAEPADYSAPTVVPGGQSPSQADAAAESGRAARRRAAEDAARAAAADSRRRVFMVTGVVLGLLVAVLLAWWVIGRSSSNAGPAPSPSASSTGPTQPTLLFQVKDSEGIAVDNALTSVGGPTGRANIVTVPSNVVVDVATGGAFPFGQIARLPDPNASADALSDAIGVVVNATLSMDTLAFSGLVDAVGGVTVDVDVDVLQKQPDGTSVVVVQAGKQKVLQGPQAAAYATYLAPGEPEEARQARFTEVFRAVLLKLPADQSKVEAILTGLGASSRATVPTSQVAAYFVRLHADVVDDDVAYQDLPVKPLAGTGESATRIDQEATAAMVAQLFPDAARKAGPNTKVRVLVQNGVGSPGLNAAARQDLVDAGFTYVNGGNAATFGRATTAIVVPDSSAESLQWGKDIAAALKVPESAVQVASAGQSVADVIVVLGADYKPTP